MQFPSLSPSGALPRAGRRGRARHRVAAVGLFQDSTRADTFADLRQQAEGLADLYATQARGDGPVPAGRAARGGDRDDALLRRARALPGRRTGLRAARARPCSPDQEALDDGRPQTFEFTPPGHDRVYLAAAHPLQIGEQTFGVIVVAKPRAEIRERWVGLAERLGLALLAGLAVAVGLVAYLSRRLTAPVVALTQATDEVARGRYDVELPRASGRDEIGHPHARGSADMTRRLAEAEELERNFLMSVSHELRTPLTAIRGHVGALGEGLVEDPEMREASLEVIRTETDRLSRLVGDLLDLARLDARRFTARRGGGRSAAAPGEAPTTRAPRRPRRAGSRTSATSTPTRCSSPTATASSRSSRTSWTTRSSGRRTAAGSGSG